MVHGNRSAAAGPGELPAEVGSPRLRYVRAPGRREQILSRVRLAGFCSVTDLAADLDVSDMTIRRDLRRLESDGEVRMVHGGASLVHATLRTTEFTARARVNAEAKDRIGAAAVADVRARDVLAFDAGTTVFDAATHLPEGFGGYVVTHSVPVIQHLLHVPTVRVTCLGGELFAPSQAFAGPATVEQAARLRIDRFLLGAAAVDERGVYVEADVEREVKTALMDAATEVVLLVDEDKFTRSAPVRLCGFDRLDALVTDVRPSRAVTAALRQHHVTLQVAGQ
ncbi:MAG: DeoR/GlpR family DNA-binding transcription regulator [Jatrophihabitans sp.]